MGVLSTLRGPVGCRLLVLYRLAPRALAGLLPPELQAFEHKGFGLLGLCYTHRLRGAGPWWQSPPSQGGDLLSVRVLAEIGAGERRRPAVWVARRETSSRLSARMAGALSRGEHHACDARLEQDDCRLELQVRCGEREELFLRAELAGQLEGSIFAHPREVEQLWALPRVVRPKSPFDALSGERDGPALARGQISAEPLRVLELRAEPLPLEGASAVPAEFDSAFRLVKLRRATALSGPAHAPPKGWFPAPVGS